MIERVSVWRSCHNCSRWRGLVMIVDNLWQPFHILLLGSIDGFLHIVHKEIPIVVMTYIFLVHVRRSHIPFLDILTAHIPIGHDFMPIRIGMDHQNDHIIEDPHVFLIGSGQQIIYGRDQLMRTHGLCGM